VSDASPAVLLPPICGAEGLAPEQLRALLQSGARCVIFEYCVSLLVVSTRGTSAVHLLRPGEKGVRPCLGWTILTLLLGWWGLPWGIVYTPFVLVNNLSGGLDVTAQVLAQLAPAKEEADPVS
jgi:hypothetical protein